MTKKYLEAIEEFVAEKKIAVVGVSRTPNKFGNYIFKALLKKGYHVLPVNPQMEKIFDYQCYPNLRSLPDKVGGAVVVVNPPRAEEVVKDAHSAGIPRVWLQQGSESAASVKFCRDHGIPVISGECILMFAHPVGFLHRIHRFFWNIFHRINQ